MPTGASKGFTCLGALHGLQPQTLAYILGVAEHVLPLFTSHLDRATGVAGKHT